MLAKRGSRTNPVLAQLVDDAAPFAARQLFDGSADVAEADAVAHHGDPRIASAPGDVDEVSPWKPSRPVVTSTLTMSWGASTTSGRGIP